MITEANDSVSPGSAGFSSEGGRAEWLYYTRGNTLADDALALVGWAEPKGDGRLTRALPRVHPQYPWMACTVVNVRGQGLIDNLEPEGLEEVGVRVEAEEVESTADSVSLPPATPTYLSYCRYDLQATFDTPPYALYPDLDIEMLPGDWKDDTGTTRTFSYATEYKRFVDWPRFPATEFLQFRHGQMVFRSTDSRINGAACAGLSRIPMRKKMLKAMWYRVPESYVYHAASYLDRFLWRVNQNPVTWGGETYQSGELLYAGYSFPKRNVRAFPEEDPLWPGFYTNEKILDVELTFGVCRWSDPDAITPANPNWIARGHNLEISARTRKPHYITTLPLMPVPPSLEETVPDDEPLHWVPKYYSAPLELLFTDPAFTQDIGALLE